MPHERRTGYTFVVSDSLQTILPDVAPKAMNAEIPLTGFASETVSFQIAYLPPTTTTLGKPTSLRFEIGTEAAPYTALSAVELVPCSLLAYDLHDDGYLLDRPGLYPDVLRPLPPGAAVRPIIGQWRAIWVAVTIPDGVDGMLPVNVTVRDGDSALLFTTTMPLHVSSLRLPALDIVNTHWMHFDAIADHYGYEVFSEQHWASIRKFAAKAVFLGINSLLTPVWTPPLDTAVGSTRRAVQLVGIREDGDGYAFDFSKLMRWMDLCKEVGICYLEIAHLFTQWGAEFVPQINVETVHGFEHRFGWHTAATDPEYRRLLQSLIPALRDVLDRNWGLDRVFFHISDEPSREKQASYREARAVVADLLEGCTVIDALSHFEFYADGDVTTPVVATDAVEPFLAARVPGLWMYFCIAQHRNVANRFIGLPAARHRAIGTHLFLHDVVGFLHWGYNFYYTQLSTRLINPFEETCCGGQFLAGEAFIVYPGENGAPLESTRAHVFMQAMTDHRAMQMLRDLAGKDAVRAIVDPAGTTTMTSFSSEADHYLRVRAELTREIVRRSAIAASPAASGRTEKAV